MADTFASIFLHLVFSTKKRQRLIVPELRPRLYQYMTGIVQDIGGSMISIGGMEDHAHLPVRWNTEGIKMLVGEVKAGSSRFVNEELPQFAPFYWQAGGGIFSVSKSETDRVVRYIETQEEHHRRRTFKEEYLESLRKHEVEHDERHVWD